MPVGEILGFVLVTIAILILGRAGYLILGPGRRSQSGVDPELMQELQDRLIETEERLDSAEQALRRQSERERLRPGENDG